MELEIPSALIREIQLAFRREAGVPTYDPADPAFPSLPTIQETISALDPSLPSHLRCRRCRGGLLRGLESTICIFCGAGRRMEAPPQAISFNSTAGCRKLLEYLDLNGSEAVTLDAESSNSSKGQIAPKDGLVLSGLLDLELRWPLEREKIDNSSTNKAPSENSFALNLSGVDLDTFFSDSKVGTTTNAVSLSSEQLMPKKQIVNIDDRVSSDSQTFGFFENLQSSDMTVSFSADTKGGEFGNSFADWEADFQSASSEAYAAESKSDDLFQGSSTTEFSNPATIAATISQQRSIKDNEAQLSSSNDRIQDDTLDAWQDFTSLGEAPGDLADSWTQNVTVASSTKEIKDSKNLDHNDDSLDAWQGFTGSGEAQGSTNYWAQNGTEATSYEHVSAMKSGDLHDMEFGSFLHSDSFSRALGDQEGSCELNSMQLDPSVSNRTNATDGGDSATRSTTKATDGGDSATQGTTKIDEDSTAAPNLDSSSNVEKLLSQMHDLSFMLDSNLSIPKAVDGSVLNP